MDGHCLTLAMSRGMIRATNLPRGGLVIRSLYRAPDVTLILLALLLLPAGMILWLRRRAWM